MEGVSSGWDVKLYNKGPSVSEDDYTCGICLNLVRDAVQTPCHHYFCDVCMKKWLQHHHACPMDQRLVRQSDVTPATDFRSRMLGLEVQCASFDTCHWHGSLSALESHQIDCPIPCFYGCGVKLRGSDMLSHSSTCTEKPVPCESANIGCGYIASKAQLQKHLKDCPYYKMRAAIQKMDEFAQKQEEFKNSQEQRFNQLSSQVEKLTHMMQTILSAGLQQQQMIQPIVAKVNNIESAALLSHKWGSNGNGDGQFDCPWGVTLSPAGYIYASDFRNHRIQAFHLNTQQFLLKFGTQGDKENQLKYPVDLKIDQQGLVYVCDSDNHRIQIYRPEGAWVRSVGSYGGSPCQFQHPRAIAIDRRGCMYVVDKGNNRVQVITPEGRFITSFGGQGANRDLGDGKYEEAPDGKFYNPCGIAIDSQDRVYVTDYSNNRVQVFTLEGKFIRKFGRPGVLQGEFSQPHGIAVDANGLVYVTETGNRRVQVFDAQGTSIKMFGSNGTGDGQFKDPRCIAVNHAGLVYVSDTQKNNIQVFRLEGH